jgi:pimeloyl-ACP methyl ester carboxylesterase
MSQYLRTQSRIGKRSGLVAIAASLFRGTVQLLLLGFVCAPVISLPALAEVQPFPPGFHTEEIKTDGATIYVRVGGKGPAVVMLHGFGDTGDMWAPLAAALVQNHTIVVPDLRGMGLSSHPETGYDKKTQATDIARVLDKLGIQKADLVTHDIGNMVGYAFAAQYPDHVTRWAALDAPLPGIGPWEEILRSPILWHFNFRGPDVERLVAGRERIYLDRFYNELSANPKAIDEATRKHYARLYAQPGAMHSAFNQFAAFNQDAIDNKEFLAKGELTMPVLAIGAGKSFGTQMADVLRFVATDVTGIVIPNSGHWLMEEQPAATVAAIRAFIDQK